MPSPSPKLDAVLEGPGRFHALVHQASLPSTNGALAERPELPMGVAVVADSQTAGRGRAGRGWENHPSDPEGSLLVSVVVQPPLDLPLTPLAAGLAVADAVARHAGNGPASRVGLKWPNDVLLGGRKVAGILAEHHGPHRTADGAVFPARVILGIGIDVDWRDVPRAGEQTAWTSVAESAGEPVDRWDLLADLLVAVDTWLGQLETPQHHTLDLYRARCVTLDQQVRVALADGSDLVGTASGLDRTGALQVTDANGATTAVRAGDVTLVRPK